MNGLRHIRHNDRVDPYPRTWVEVDLEALAHNLAVIRRRLKPQVKLMLVAKADAYGHGLVPVCRYADRNGADWFGVATVPEGITLRESGIERPVAVISPTLPDEADQAVFYGLDALVESVSSASAFSRAATKLKRTARLHLEVDTGISRFGCPPEQAATVAQQVASLPGVQLVGLAQHFVDSTNDSPKSEGQMQAFHQALSQVDLPLEVVHMANSGGTLRHPGSHHDLVRVGHLAYGFDPGGLAGGEVKPVLSWYARVTAIRTIPAGATVGYASTFRASRPTAIATLGVGYGDGFPRCLSNEGFVRFGEVDAPVVGLICMDQTLVDVTDVPGVRLGQVASVIGAGIGVERVAAWARTNSHEIVTRIMSRVPRRYRYGSGSR